MIFNLLFLSIFSQVSSQCTNMLFLEHYTHFEKTSKSTSKTFLPALIWKDHIIKHSYGTEKFTNVDIEQYEFMTHAYMEGLIIHRLCKKNTEYPKYGKITKTDMRGYVVEVNDMFKTDMFLYHNRFTTYAHGHQMYNFEEYKKNEEDKKIQEYKNNSPVEYYIFFVVMPGSFYLFILYIIEIIIYNF